MPFLDRMMQNYYRQHVIYFLVDCLISYHGICHPDWLITTDPTLFAMLVTNAQATLARNTNLFM